jgi:Haem-binding domain
MDGKKIKIVVNRFLIVVFLAFVVMQAFHPAKNNDASVTADDITKVCQVPDSVMVLLRTACYDCHSNNTVYPWYNRIQPVAWWLDDHIEEGKRHVNFSEFGKYTPERQAKKLRKCAHEMEEGDMPLNFYVWIHKDAILNEADKKMVMDWLNGQAERIFPKKP